ncbi:hypothetical protein [Streptomyces asiaticus]|uniref:hypothetical protein n=1 Tax=Streptomyces asiaticus TaxID=114695 RepID=UPI0031DFF710
MAVRIHYGGNTYIEAKYDLDDTISRISEALGSEKRMGILRVTTAKGTVDLVISPHIPIAVENHDPSAIKPTA